MPCLNEYKVLIVFIQYQVSRIQHLESRSKTTEGIK